MIVINAPITATVVMRVCAARHAQPEDVVVRPAPANAAMMTASATAAMVMFAVTVEGAKEEILIAQEVHAAAVTIQVISDVKVLYVNAEVVATRLADHHVIAARKTAVTS